VRRIGVFSCHIRYFMHLTFRRSAAFAILCTLTVAAHQLGTLENGRQLAFSLLAGIAFGIVMQRGRFCFLCNFRDFIDDRRSDGVLAILVALLAGVVFYQIITIAWMPVPQPGRLPPNAHIGPVGWVLALASTVFGVGAALSGSCLSGHFYRLGEEPLVPLLPLPVQPSVFCWLSSAGIFFIRSAFSTIRRLRFGRANLHCSLFRQDGACSNGLTGKPAAAGPAKRFC